MDSLATVVQLVGLLAIIAFAAVVWLDKVMGK